MRLSRYFSSIVAGSIGLVLVVLVVLVVAVTLVENAGDLTDSVAGAKATLWLALFSSVQYAYQVLPIACFLGVLVAGTVLARRGELLAAQAAGISTMRLALSFFAVVVVAATLGAGCGELLVPRSVVGAERVMRDDLQQKSELSRFYNRRLQWYREGDLLVFLSTVDRETQTVESPVVYRFEDSLISEVIEAKALKHGDSGWWLENARVRRASSAEVVELEIMPLGLSIAPLDLIDVTGDPRQMSSLEVRGLVERRQNAGFDATSHLLELHSRFAMPISSIWMFLLVGVWALHPERRRSLAVTLGAGVMAIAVLLAVTHTFRLLALGHKISVALGVWGPGLVSLALIPVSLLAYKRFRVRGSLW